MKKIIKIFSLLMFIIFVFGITTSCNAWEDWDDKHKGITPLKVESTHTGNEMIEAVLNEGHYLTGISWDFLKAHEAIYCRNRFLAISSSARYLADGEKIEYPKDDLENGYARAYILANNLYTEEDGLTINEIKQIKQTTWHLLNGQGKDKDDKTLLNIAKKYQEYKSQFTEDNPEEVSVLYGEKTGAQLTTIGEDLAYGPIKIGYSYAGITENGKTDEWGGFYYTFINESQEDISDKVILCTKTEEGSLEPIVSNKKIITIDNKELEYYKVSTLDYNNIDLYLKISTDISKLSMKIFENKVDYSASVLELEGTRYAENAWTSLCQDCDEKYNSAKIINLDDRGTIDWEDVLSNEVVQADVDFDNDGKMTVNNFKTIIIYQGKKYMYLGTSLGSSSVNEGINAGEIIFSDRFGSATKKISRDFVCECDPNDGSSCEICSGKDKDFKYLGQYKLACGNKAIYYNNVSSCYSDVTSASDIYYDDEAYFLCKSCGYKIWYDPTSEGDRKSGETKMIQHIEGNSDYSSKQFAQYRKILFKFRQIGCDTEIKYSLKDETQTRHCGIHSNPDIYYGSQQLTIVDTTKMDYSNSAEFEIEIPLSVSIEVTKKWDDNNNSNRPSDIGLKVYRSTDQATWEELTINTDYKIKWTTTTENTWKAIISDLEKTNSEGKDYYFKVIEEAEEDYSVAYKSGNYTDGKVDNANYKITLTNTLRIGIGGYVWLDEQTGIKPAIGPNGIMDDNETKMEGIVVYLYRDGTKVAQTVTDQNGYYIFEGYEIGQYHIEFEYDGINYEDTKQADNGSSKAFEVDADRDTFNERFKTITYGKSNDGTTLSYKYENGKSTLITKNENGAVKQEFIMYATTEDQMITKNVDDLNLGLVKRETDIALSTDVANAQVSINGEKTDYNYNKDDNTIVIGNTQTSEQISYNLNLYSSDYNYRIRDYVTNNGFKQKDYMNEQVPEGVKTGEELKVLVTYELNLQNQSTKNIKINEVKYSYDEKYTFKEIVGGGYNVINSENILTINLNGLALGDGETKTVYLVFEVNDNNGLTLGDFSNKAEITSYSTDEGFIDVDSQPGNFISDNQVEDDSDTAGGLSIKLVSETERKIKGKVFANNNENVNDVIVQLIELKTVNGKVYEYIWQETVSGTGKGLRLNAQGTATEEYSYNKANGEYEFSGYIPGEYIVRFIYGDGKTYDLTDNVIKYNGQDYKSVADANYNKEWYNSASYTQGASVARDNEARRLETMAYAVEIDAKKGLLLKLLDNKTLNLTEKETLISIYNELNDTYGTSDITYTDINGVSDEVINAVTKVLLLKEVLPNTWMCAETSKINVSVDNNTEGKASYENINLGLELRPQTKIELKKYITGFKLTAADGQTLVNAYIDVNEYLNNPEDISNKVQGIKDNVTILNTLWQYEVSPVDINTVVDGAKLEFQYTLAIKNIGDTDYLSTELANAYNGDITAYRNTLTTKADAIKGYMRSGTYIAQIGKTLGNSYYVGGTGEEKVLTEVTNIRDYINNDLSYTASGENVTVDETAPKTYRILRDDYSMQQTTINTILKTTQGTGKMNNNGNVVLYTVTLGKNPISSTGNLNFDTYIAEVMSYTNAAGRRSMEMTPGNAEIIDHEYRDGKTHEIDEADTGRIQLGVATGEDEKTNYIIIISVIAGIALLATGAFVVKKYVIK